MEMPVYYLSLSNLDDYFDFFVKSNGSKYSIANVLYTEEDRLLCNFRHIGL